MDYNQNGMGYDPNNMGYDRNGMGYDQGNNMGYNPNGGQMGGYQQQMPQQMPQQTPMQPMQQQQMMQQQRFGGMQQGYGMNQPMQQQPMQQDYGMPQQNIYDQSDMSFGGGSNGGSGKRNQIPIIIAMVLVLVVGGVIIAFLLKDDSSSGGSSKKKKEETKIEIKAPSKPYSGSITDYSAIKKYYEDNYKVSCDEDGDNCLFSFSDDVYVALNKNGSKLKRISVGDKKKNLETYTILLAPFLDNGTKKEDVGHAISWMDEGLLYTDVDYDLGANDGTIILEVDRLSKPNEKLIELKENNKFALSNNEYGKKYTVDVQHYNDNYKTTLLRALSSEDSSSMAMYTYEGDNYTVNVSYKFEEDKLNLDNTGYENVLKEYNDVSRPEKGGRVCYKKEVAGDYYLECYDYTQLGESSMGHGYQIYFIIRTTYSFEGASGKSLRDSSTTKAADYIKKLHSGIKVVS